GVVAAHRDNATRRRRQCTAMLAPATLPRHTGVPDSQEKNAVELRAPEATQTSPLRLEITIPAAIPAAGEISGLVLACTLIANMRELGSLTRHQVAALIGGRCSTTTAVPGTAIARLPAGAGGRATQWMHAERAWMSRPPTSPRRSIT